MMPSHHPPMGHHRTFLQGIPVLLAVLIPLLAACNIPASRQPTPSPVVITVPVTASTQTASTQVAASDTPVALNPTATLTFTPPPPPEPPQVSRGGPNGDNQEHFPFALDFTPLYFLRLYVFYSPDGTDKFKASKDGKNIASVEFQVTSPNGNKQYYDRTEKNAGYCIFGGGEPDCNPWTFEDGAYKWKSGGQPVKSGKYGLTITATADNGDSGVWLWNAQGNNPITIEVP